jgi:hypothetical protein
VLILVCSLRLAHFKDFMSIIRFFVDTINTGCINVELPPVSQPFSPHRRTSQNKDVYGSNKRDICTSIERHSLNTATFIKRPRTCFLKAHRAVTRFPQRHNLWLLHNIAGSSASLWGQVEQLPTRYVTDKFSQGNKFNQCTPCLFLFFDGSKICFIALHFFGFLVNLEAKYETFVNC